PAPRPDARGRVRDRRPREQGRLDLLQGAREAARQPDLDRRRRLPTRLADHAVARRARGAAPRRPLPHRGRPRPRMTAALVIAALVAVAAVVLLALPFLRDPAPTADRLEMQDELERRRLALAEERDRALAALKELEFDHRTGKISDEDYRRLVGPLRAAAAEAMRALEPEVPEPPQPPGEPVPLP